jgi:hypothetical protein
MDFATFLIVAALLTWGWLLSRLKASVAGYRAVAAGGIVLVLYGALFGIAISTTGYYDSLRTGQPGTYRALERFFSPLPTLATMMVRQPVLVHVSNPTGYSAQVNYGMAGAGAATFALGGEPATIEIVSPKSGVIALEATLRRGPTAPQDTLLQVAATSRERKGSWCRP